VSEGLSLLNTRLRQTRKARGLSQETLAKRSRVDLATISRLECKPQNPTITSLSNLAEALEVTLAFLLGKVDRDVAFDVALRREALRQFLLPRAGDYDEQQKKNLEDLCLFDSAPNSVRGWEDLTQNCNFLHTHGCLE
jgi:transcriptional regulator with XRE-family HTH domain